MQRLNRVLSAAAIVGISCAAGAAPSAMAQDARAAEGQTAHAAQGRITGMVSDDGGGPLAGAMVSAAGRTIATTISDARGQFSIDALPAGQYVVQAHLRGFAGSPRQFVQVGGATALVPDLQLRRLDAAVATSGSVATAPVAARHIIAAGFELPNATLSDQPDASVDVAARDDHPHSETAWRLRHIKRSILKDASPVITLVERDAEIEPGSIFGRAVDSAAGFATSLFTELPFSGEVNLLTTGVYGPGELFSGDGLPRGVAYLAIGAPTALGDWSVQAAMSEGELSSWLVAGAFTSRRLASHEYQFGLSYSTQEYTGGNPAALAAVKEGSRNVGEVYAFDRWSLAPRVSLEYGGRYARYDYLEDRTLFSPRAGLSVEPIRNTRIITRVAQRMLAPGAEEFLASDTPGPWLPPERTFAPLGSPASIDPFRVQRSRHLDVTIEHEFDKAYVLGLRRFYQSVDDQLVTLFGLELPEGPRSVGHYYVASAGGFDADGWAIRLDRASTGRLRGSVDYSVTRARWLTRGDAAGIAAWVPAAIRADREDLHDLTTRVETDIPETATRVFVIYRINSGYTRADTDLTRPGLAARFDLQVNQALPFALGGTRWEVLVGIRNLFRDPGEAGSVYDELLVVRPSKRVVGGFLVRF